MATGVGDLRGAVVVGGRPEHIPEGCCETTPNGDMLVIKEADMPLADLICCVLGATIPVRDKRSGRKGVNLRLRDTRSRPKRAG